MNTFQKVLAIPGAAPVMAAKILGRFIDQCARGFHEDAVLTDELALYKAIEAQYPQTTVSLPSMFKSMLKRAKTEVAEGFNDTLEGMSEEQKALWTSDGELTEREALLKAMPVITKLFSEAEADPERWDDMPTIAQWSLLNATEAALPGKIELYKGWALRDQVNQRTNSNSAKLAKDAEGAVKPLYMVVTDFLNDDNVKADLAKEAEAGVNVAPRLIAA